MTPSLLADKSVQEDSKERNGQPNQDNLTNARDNCITTKNTQDTTTTINSLNKDNDHPKK